MIKRELYMSRIRPFIGTELVKVMTGIRRCGKSVMLELIQQELTESGVSSALLGMWLFRHKTRKAKIFVTVPLLLTAQCALLYWLSVH